MRKSGKITSVGDLEEEASEIRETVPTEAWGSLERFEAMAEAYRSGEASYTVRGREIPVKTTHETMSGTKVPRVALPTSEDWGERLKWIRKENVPGSFPYTGGVFPFRREDELPVRMFAGEGSAERTNKRDIIFFPRIKTSTVSQWLSTPLACMETIHKNAWIFLGRFASRGSA